MTTSTSEGKHGIQWTARMQMDDLNFAHDLALLSHTQQQKQGKTTSVAAIGLNIHKGKSKGGSDADVKARIGKARAAYLQLKNVWNAKQLSTNTKVRIFNTNVKTVQLYVAETWTTKKAIIQKIQLLIQVLEKTKEHITPRNGDRHEKNEQEFDITRKAGLERKSCSESTAMKLLTIGTNLMYASSQSHSLQQALYDFTL
ncbi:unnamed protein product [Schistosoma margrebowiei]|uniref:Uncharacterized protein n=1 Tax=Schistosoma margrebowiei TaxID=48269 RepID=A0A183LYJ9_9TREM|nr:unnamed protein product [Schistosoma margrebowiei]